MEMSYYIGVLINVILSVFSIIKMTKVDLIRVVSDSVLIQTILVLVLKTQVRSCLRNFVFCLFLNCHNQ